MGSPTKNTVVSALTLLFLAGAAVDRNSSMVVPEDTVPYQARIREAYAQLPMRLGDWIGEETPVPREAVTLLRPNVIISRRYTNFVTGRTADFLLTQCADARDMAGHYPPICYPNQGWVQVREEEHDWSVDGRTINGMAYQFVYTRDGTEVRRTVNNFMILPDGTFARDMDAIRKSTSVRRRFYGAGQVQVLCATGLPAEEQEEIVTSLVEGHMPVITAILSGTPAPSRAAETAVGP